MGDASDEVLMDRYQQGNTDALEELYSRYKVVLYNYIIRLVKDAHLSEDIIQDVFIRLIKKAGSFSPSGTGSFKAWLYTIATNLCRDKQRRTEKAKEVVSSQIDEIVKQGDYGYARSLTEEQEQIQQVLESLSPEQKEVVMLRIYSGLSFKEISIIQKAPLNTVLARMYYALKNIRQRLGES